MGRSPPDEAEAPVSAALDGLAVLEKARAPAVEGRVRIDDAIAAVAAELWLLWAFAAAAGARENRAAAQRATLGAILVSEGDMVAGKNGFGNGQRLRLIDRDYKIYGVKEDLGDVGDGMMGF